MILPELESLSWAFITLAFGIVWRSSIVAALCGGLAWLLRSKTAELRWTLWRWALLAPFALPFLMRVAPPLNKTFQAVSTLEAAVIPAISQDAIPAEPVRHSRALSLKRSERGAPSSLIVAPVLYVLVALFLLTRFALSRIHLKQIAQNSEVIRDLGFSELAHEISLNSEALWVPRVAVSDKVSAPVTFNAGDVLILLPQAWPTWSKAKLRVVLAHEMAHVRRDDSAHLQFASLMTCIFWFHPLSWFLRRQLAALAEEACDEAVISSEASPEQYANFLIDFARDVQCGRGRLLAGANAIVRGPALEKRIRKIFAVSGNPQRRWKVHYYAALLLFVPSLYLLASLPNGQPYQERKVSHDEKVV